MVVVRFTYGTQLIREGIKRQTIRPKLGGKEPYPNIRAGGKIHCYSVKKIKGVRRPILNELLYKGKVTQIIYIYWENIKDDDDIAIMDGFPNAEEMRRWFRERYGNKLKDDTIMKIIRWE